MRKTHVKGCVRGAGRALGLILATTIAAVAPAALGSPGTYAAPAVTMAHATHGPTQHGVQAKTPGSATLPQIPCWTVGVFVGDAGFDCQTTTGRVAYWIRGIDASYSVTYVAPGADTWSTCVEGRGRAIVALKGVCVVPIGSWVFADLLGVVGAIEIREQH